MSMVTELFGKDIIYATLEDVKEKIRSLPPAQLERRTYILHDWAAITGVDLTEDDFKDVE